MLASYNEAEDLINIGAYAKGSNPKIDYAISKIDAINDFLRAELYRDNDLERFNRTLGSVLSDRKDEEPLKKESPTIRQNLIIPVILDHLMCLADPMKLLP